jgi:hypothetical protein
LQDSSALSPGEDAADGVTATPTVRETNGTSQKDDTPGPEPAAKPNSAAPSTPPVTEYDRIQQLARKMSTPKSDTPAAAKTKTTSRPSKSLAAHIKATAGKSGDGGGATADGIIPNSPGPVDSLAERLPSDSDIVRAAETSSQTTPSGKTVRKSGGKKAGVAGAVMSSSSGEATSVEVMEESAQVGEGGGARRGPAAKRPGGELKNIEEKNWRKSLLLFSFMGG